MGTGASELTVHSPSSAVLKLRDGVAIPGKRLVGRIVVPKAVRIASATVDEPIRRPGGRWCAADLVGHWDPPLTTSLMAVNEIGFHTRPLPE